MHYPVQFSKNANDSVFDEYFEEVIRFNSDSVFYHVAVRKRADVEDELRFYYFDIIPYTSEKQKENELKKMKQAAKRYKSRALEDEIECMEIIIMPENTDKAKEIKMDAFKRLAKKEAKRGNIHRELCALFQTIYYNTLPSIFRNAPELVKRLQEVSDEQFDGKGEVYGYLGATYYRFHNYDRAIPYLKLSLRDSVRYFKDRYNLLSRDILAAYYNSINKLDSSDYYFRSMYDSPDYVKDRPMYDVIAITGIADNQIKRKQYEKALPLLKMCLPEALIDKDFPFSFKIALSMVECNIGMGKLLQAKAMIDSAKVIGAKAIDRHTKINYVRFYSVMGKYYAVTSNSRLVQDCLDSLQVAIKKNDDAYSSQNILNNEQIYYENEKKLALDKLEMDRIKLIFSLIIIGIITPICLFYVRLYLKKKAAYHALVQRIQQWAERSSFIMPLSLPAAGHVTDEVVDAEYMEIKDNPADIPFSKHGVNRELFDKLEQLFQSEKLYRHPDVSLEYVANKLNINRSQLSYIVNNFTGKNFNIYVNEYRIKEAVRLLSSPKADNFSLEGIALESGFKNRKTFYEAFKKTTGLSPSVFKNNLQK